ncbi:DUF3105 domain-containing protein [Glycomyces harbinensis]|uniref:DUF3105 domain-containing protein n=1 Tax=Glycomyces harbinensis TaxID=58114 RepID=A0A1G6TXB0_9ACTN|nr:DUF3105 domain-containing protein [Glycomyces harbinensis]SDD33086.1 Protein of unknown function [Glycomyces harbinensis]
MRPLRQRWTALAPILALAALAACSSPADDAAEEGAAAAEGSTEAPAPLEGVESFYGEYGDFVTVTAAIQAGDVTAEELEYPVVAQQEHVDAAMGWDGTNPEYELSPPVGGNHLSVWQTCNGSVYDAPLVEGNAVHSMEHGAVWLTYDPELVDQAHVDALALLIGGRDYSLMSPYPGQGVAVSLQSWGNRYQTDDPADAMIEEYLDVYILNERFNPEAMATCSGGNTATAP